jgi:hypothetical protein
MQASDKSDKSGKVKKGEPQGWLSSPKERKALNITG